MNDLLRLEMELLWERDAYGRLGRHSLVAFAIADDEQVVRFGPMVGDDIRQVLERDILSSVGDVSVALEKARESLASFGPLRVSGGPSYVFGKEALARGRISSAMDVLTSEDKGYMVPAAARPEAWWEPQEWDDLLAGRLGPWAIGLIGGRVAALCHTPVGSRVAAEAGVWTHPDERGRGYAPAVTTAWARVARRRFGTLFYSTQDDNIASQAVARKLGLVSIGRIWQVTMGE